MQKIYIGSLVQWKSRICTVTGIYEFDDEVSLISCVDNCEIQHVKMSECTIISDDYKKDYKINDVVINNRTGSLCIIKEILNEYLAIVSTVSNLNNNFNDTYDTYAEYMYNLTSAYYTISENDYKIDLTNKVKVGDLVYSTVMGYVNVLSVSDNKIVINTDNEIIELDKYGALSEHGECLIYPYKEVRNWEYITTDTNSEATTSDIEPEYVDTNTDK